MFIKRFWWKKLKFINREVSTIKDWYIIKYKIEINKNFFLKPTTKFTESHVNKPNKNVDIEAKVPRENIKRTLL